MKKKLAIIALSAILLSVPTLSVVDANDTQEPIAQEQWQSVTDEVYDNKLSAVSLTATGYSIGQVVSHRGIAEREPKSSSNISVEKTGFQVFASNAPETIKYNTQINQTLYKDNVHGKFRVWTSHFNDVSTRLNFYVYIKNPTSNPVNLYKIRESSSAGGITAAPLEATQQFMRKNGATQKSKPDVVIPAGGSYTINYGSSVGQQRAAVYIGDFIAMSVINGRESGPADLKVSDIVTNSSSANLDKISNTATIAPTNFGFKQSDDNYRGLLKFSGRTVTFNNFTLTPSSPAKYLGVSDGYGAEFKDEQDELLSRWTVEGNPQNQAPVIGRISGKKAGAFWCTDYTYKIDIKNNTGRSNVYTIYGGIDRPDLKDDPKWAEKVKSGFINYKTDTGALGYYNYSKLNGMVISNRSKYDLYTMVQPGASLPLGIYFVAK